MKLVTIKSITDCTITFSKINLILRGNCNNLSLYPTSYARHIKIETEEQEKELSSLQNLNLIQVIVEEEITDKPSVNTNEVELAQEVEQELTQEVAQKVAQEAAQEIAQEIFQKATKESKPKNIPEKNEKTDKKKTPDHKSKKFKKVSRKEDQDTEIEDVDIKETDITDESILAAIKLDEERNSVNNIVYEKEPDAHEKNNGYAVISTGHKSTIKSKMQRCIINGSEEIDKQTPFIDNPDTIKKLDEMADNAFIDKKSQDDTSDAFVEV